MENTSEKNLNGQQKSRLAIAKFKQWVKGRTNEQYADIIEGRKLSRTKIGKQAGIAREQCTKNRDIKRLLKKVENGLRVRGILPPIEESQSSAKPNTFSSKEVAALEKKIDKLQKENSRLLSENVLLKTEQDKGRVHDGRFSEHIIVAHEIADMLLKSK